MNKIIASKELRLKLYDRCKSYLQFKKVKGYPKIKYNDFSERRIYFVEVAKGKRLQEITWCDGFVYVDSLFVVNKKKDFFGKLKEDKFLKQCKIFEKNIPILLTDLIFYNKYQDEIMPTIEVSQNTRKDETK